MLLLAITKSSSRTTSGPPSLCELLKPSSSTDLLKLSSSPSLPGGAGQGSPVPCPAWVSSHHMLAKTH